MPTAADSNTVARLRLATERANREGQACGRKFSMTIQTRECVAAMRALGVKRAEFTARTSYDRKRGEYGSCICNPHTRDANRAVADNAEALAEVGFSVYVMDRADGEPHSWFGTGGAGGVYDMRDGRVERRS